MPRSETKLCFVYPLVVAAALLGAAAGHTEISGTMVQPSATSVHPGEGSTAGATGPPAVEGVAPAGNPLWAIPLKQLSTTRERPIFSPSRRPPPPLVVTPVNVVPIAPRSLPAEPKRPAISLVGTVAGKTLGIGIFIAPATQDIVRLRLGDDYQGWVLRSANGRTATLEKDSETAVLELAPPGSIVAATANTPAPPARRPPRG
jgi:hypothetical protein